jgi:hypothetical protein
VRVACVDTGRRSTAGFEVRGARTGLAGAGARRGEQMSQSPVSNP